MGKQSFSSESTIILGVNIIGCEKLGDGYTMYFSNKYEKNKKSLSAKAENNKRVYQLKLKTKKEFNATNEDELLEQVMLWPKVDKEWDKGWKRIEPKKNKGSIIRKNKIIQLISEGNMSYCEDECYCPNCGNSSSESMEEAMKGVWMYHLHYCQKCGCSFKILRKSRRK